MGRSKPQDVNVTSNQGNPVSGKIVTGSTPFNVLSGGTSKSEPTDSRGNTTVPKTTPSTKFSVSGSGKVSKGKR